MDQPKISRVLRLMKLMSGPVDHSVEELARRLDTSARSIYRYVDTFREVGFVVYKSESGAFKLGTDDDRLDGFGSLTFFTDDEATVFNQLLDALDDANELKAGLRRKLNSVFECTAMAGSTVVGRNADCIRLLREAISAKRVAILRDYSSAHSASVADRRVEPFGFSTNYVQVWCYDTLDGRVKMFKTARIGRVELTCDPWAREAEHVVGHEDIFRMVGFELHPIALRLGVRARNLLCEEFPKSVDAIRQDGAASWLLETSVCDFAGAARFVLGLADDIEVLGSPEFREYLRGKVEAMNF